RPDGVDLRDAVPQRAGRVARRADRGAPAVGRAGVCDRASVRDLARRGSDRRRVLCVFPGDPGDRSAASGELADPRARRGVSRMAAAVAGRRRRGVDRNRVRRGHDVEGGGGAASRAALAVMSAALLMQTARCALMLADPYAQRSGGLLLFWTAKVLLLAA